MAFNVTSDHNHMERTLTVILEGELDSLAAPQFMNEIESANAEVDQLVLEMTELTYMSSAGLRGLVFARQKMPDSVRIVIVGARDPIEQTIRMVGFHRSVVFSDQVDQ
jgi:anti-anti-sigma factor